jgi:hypothetical protein
MRTPATTTTPRADFDHRECGAAFGFLPNGDGSETPDQLWRALRRGIAAVAFELGMDRIGWRQISPDASLKKVLKTESAVLVRRCIHGLLRYCIGIDEHLDDLGNELSELLALAALFRKSLRPDPSEWRRFSEQLNQLALQLTPHEGAPRRRMTPHMIKLMDGWIGRPVTKRVCKGIGTPEEAEAVLLVLRGRLSLWRLVNIECRRAAWTLAQIAHDPRVGHTRSYMDGGSGARVATHRRRKKRAETGVKVSKVKPNVFLEPRFVVPPAEPIWDFMRLPGDDMRSCACLKVLSSRPLVGLADYNVERAI